MAAWLVGMCHVRMRTARDWVRAGAALDDLPHLRGAFGEGVLSWDQIRPATSFATADTDEALAEELPAWSTAQVENEAAKHRRLNRRDARRRVRDRRVTWRRDAETGGCFYRGFLPDTEAEIVNTALTRRAEQAGPDAETGRWEPFQVRCADALVDLARQQLTDDAGPDPTLVVVHASAEIIDGMREGSGTVNGIPISRDSVLRLLCVCWAHHHLVHEGDWTVTGNADGQVTFTSPHGRTLASRPPPLRPRVRRRCTDIIGVDLGDRATEPRAGPAP